MPRKSASRKLADALGLRSLSGRIRFSAGYIPANDRGDPCAVSRSAEIHKQVRHTYTVRDHTSEA